MKVLTPLERAMTALAVIDRGIDDRHHFDEDVFRQLAQAMHDIYGPLPPPDYTGRRSAP